MEVLSTLKEAGARSVQFSSLDTIVFQHADREVKIETNFSSPVNDGLLITLSDGRHLLGSMHQDPNCPSPLEDDGAGKIHSFIIRHSNYLNPSLIPKHRLAVPLSYFEHGLCQWGLLGMLDGMPDACWDGTVNAGVWVPDKYAEEYIVCGAIRSFLPPEVSVRYESRTKANGEQLLNEIVLSIGGTKKIRGYKSFINAWKAAAKRLKVSIPPEPLKQKEREIAREQAHSVCEVYTNWCNGNCYGYSISIHGSGGELVEQKDACWGFVGVDYVEQEMQSAFEIILKKLNHE